MSRRGGGLTVGVTGPTGDLGVGVVTALERSPAVHRIVGMARRPFDPAERGWRKTEYRQGDVTDRASVHDLVAGAQVVIHLAFAVTEASDASRDVNVEGSRVVFEEAARSAERVCFASSVAAYGGRGDRAEPLAESAPLRGYRHLPYSRQKVEVERLLARVFRDRRTAAYVLRPSIVAGPHARVLLDMIPYVRLAEELPSPLRRALRAVPVARPVLPDFGVPLQLVHEDDVATAFVAAATGDGEPGAYNLAGSGLIGVRDVATALGWYSLPAPRLALDVAAAAALRTPALPAYTSWIHFIRRPPLVSTERAERKLGWRPRHTARQALNDMVWGAAR